jgi:D-alanyl-D-alanine endopeptidase (penicillin-binding protein 7)
MMRILQTLCSLPLVLAAATVLASESPLQPALIQQSSAAATRASLEAWRDLNPKKLKLRSASALVVDQYGNKIYGKETEAPLPIASITKLMTAMVVLDAKLPLEEQITITKEDRDLLKQTGSRLKYGASLSRRELIRIALVASENRAASALARTYPGGKAAFIRAMNQKARDLGMEDSWFVDSAGLDAGNVASAQDLVKMVQASRAYPLIHQATTTRSVIVHPYKRRGPLRYSNTNRLLKNNSWDIELSKTGYINEAGRCLVMQAEIAGQPLVIVLLNSFGKLTPFGDSNRIRKWIEGEVNG